jgi:glycosyltransferase involved in cell wall biosynthesis
MELTILMPCLNEEETLYICIQKAKSFLGQNNIDGEVLIADNGSTDSSVSIAENSGARVVHVERKGYGSALIAGCEAAYGQYVIMGDADDSYDFTNLMPFVEKLRAGYDLVMGNRFKGGIEKGAMPWSHRYIGNPVLSFIGRLFFKSSIKDFHCGLRGYNREQIMQLGLRTTGMEYASEMVVMAELEGLKICEVPTTLKKDGRSRPPHLRSFRDGWRHLKFLFMYSPKWLFLYPGIFFAVIGLLGSIILSFGQFRVGAVVFSIHTLLYCTMLLIVGVNIIYYYIFAKLYAEQSNFIPHDKAIDKIIAFSEDKGILLGFICVVIGIAIFIAAFVKWKITGFSELDSETMMRFAIPSATLVELGIETAFASFLIGIFKIERKEKN